MSTPHVSDFARDTRPESTSLKISGRTSVAIKSRIRGADSHSYDVSLSGAKPPGLAKSKDFGVRKSSMASTLPPSHMNGTTHGEGEHGHHCNT